MMSGWANHIEPTRGTRRYSTIIVFTPQIFSIIESTRGTRQCNLALLAESVMLGWANHIKPPRGTPHRYYSVL